MNVRISKYLTVFGIIILCNGCARMKAGKKDNFPTYEQIRGSRENMYDLVVPQASQSDFLPKKVNYTIIKRAKGD